MSRTPSAITVGVLIVGLGSYVFMFSRDAQPRSAADAPCVHSLSGDLNGTTYASPREAVAADRYGSQEAPLVEHEHRDPLYSGLENDTAIYWTRRMSDGGWVVSDRHRFASCDRDAFTGRVFARDEPGRPLPACAPFDDEEISQTDMDTAGIDLEGAPVCDSVGVPVSGIVTGPIG